MLATSLAEFTAAGVVVSLIFVLLGGVLGLSPWLLVGAAMLSSIGLGLLAGLLDSTGYRGSPPGRTPVVDDGVNRLFDGCTFLYSYSSGEEAARRSG